MAASPTPLPTPAYVVLGMLRLGPKSGYDIKRAVEVSIRFFWAISDAQIYPLLKQLEDDGLVRGRSDPRGQRRRRVYELTGEGEAALAEWLLAREPAPSLELRDVAMLKLFFADALDAEDAARRLRAFRRRSEEIVERLRAESRPQAEDAGGRYPLITLELGIAMHEAWVSRCRELERAQRD